MKYYHCTTADHGKVAELDAGGKYEKIDDDGNPMRRKFGGYVKSRTPAVCMSKSPEAALFAVAHNVTESTQLYIYETEMEPDYDLSEVVLDDFAVMEEVRYHNPHEDPIPVERAATIQLPQRAHDDVSESYNPHGPHADPPSRKLPTARSEPTFHIRWAKRIKSYLKDVLNGEEYPESVEPQPYPGYEDHQPPEESKSST